MLNHHFGIDAAAVHYTAAQMDAVFSVNECFREFLEKDNNSENMAIQVIKTFDELAKNLRSLEELPLVITSVLGKYLRKRPQSIQLRIVAYDQQFKNQILFFRSIAGVSLL